MNNTDVDSVTAYEAKGLQSANWISRTFVSLQIVLCLVLDIGFRGRIIAACIVGISIFVGGRFKLSKSLHTFLVISSGFLFACFALSRFLGEVGTGLLDLFELLAEYLIIIQSFELLRKRAVTLASYHEANYLPGLGTIAVVMLLVSREIPFSISLQNYLFFGLAVLALLVARPDFVNLLSGNRLQQRKAFALATIAAVGLCAGSLFRGEVTRQLPILQAALRTLQPPRDELERVSVASNARFVEQVSLSSISLAQRTAPDEMVFRVEGVKSPGYMRTLSFEKFDGAAWSNNWDRDRRALMGFSRIPPLNEPPTELPDISQDTEKSIFELPDRRGGSYLEMKIIVPKGNGRQVPLPLNATYVQARSEGRTVALVLDMHGNVWPNSISNGEYHVFVGSRSNWPVDDAYANRLLQVPKGDDNFIATHAAKIIGPARSTFEKVKAMEDYFRDEFEYSFDEGAIGELNGRSPLRAFLENRKAGHCELFATATALLLRSQGIACRLSTGYLVYEMNNDQEYYFARNRDAHAWVEAYDASSDSWIVVESTPGIRDLIERFNSDESQLGDTNKELANSTQAIASGLQEVLASLQILLNQVLASRFSWLIPILLGGVLWRIRARRLCVSPKESVVRNSREVRKADRRASRMGYKRAASETCLQFARRLAESAEPNRERLAAWYVDHSQRRYKQK